MAPIVRVCGGGLAGSAAAWRLAERGCRVVLYEMRPVRETAVHKTAGLAELVCSNSFRSDDWRSNAVGLLHEEMRRLGSLVMQAGDAARIPAGGALAVDRERFSALVEEKLAAREEITIERKELEALPAAEDGPWIVATGPLTSQSLAASIEAAIGEERLAFFDAIAPIVYKETVDMDVAWMQSRWDKSDPAGDGADYLNCPMDEAQYKGFVAALLEADKKEFAQFEMDAPYFDGCLPIEVMASRGEKTLAFGPMKPVGLTDPRSGKRPHAVVQLRRDNALGTLYNIVGFQTKLSYGEQKRIFRTIPGLEQAEFARLGGLHRNTFLNSPKLLDQTLRLRSRPNIRFAGQITGCEGYVESAALGWLAGEFAASEALGAPLVPPPLETAHGALLSHVTGGALEETFQPMNVNFGLFPPIEPPAGEGRRKRVGKAEKRLAMAERALHGLKNWSSTTW